jgi:hypothetical protein
MMLKIEESFYQNQIETMQRLLEAQNQYDYVYRSTLSNHSTDPNGRTEAKHDD